MTRLRELDIGPIPGSLASYDADLKRRTGLSLTQVACKAAGVGEAELEAMLRDTTVAAVPVTTGLGIIRGFSHAVAAIVAYLGFKTLVTEEVDRVGMREGMERGGDILMLADDDHFVAMTPGGQELADNARATAEGFVAALEAMNGGVRGEPVLVLGCGPVGMAASEALMAWGARVRLFDIEGDRALSALRRLAQDPSEEVQVEEDGLRAMKNYGLVFDATNTGGFIESHHLASDALVAAPGMPCALTPEAFAENRDRILHDALEIGTATMVVQAAVKLAGNPVWGEADKG
jgi:pyrrolysine biosynthesis protein PylD